MLSTYNWTCTEPSRGYGSNIGYGYAMVYPYHGDHMLWSCFGMKPSMVVVTHTNLVNDGRYLCFKGATGNGTKFVFPPFGHPFLISTISTFSLAQKAGWYWGCLEEFCGSSGSNGSNFIFPIFSVVFPEPIDPSHAPLAFRCFLSGVSGADASNPPAVEILCLLPSLGGMRWERLWLVGGDWNHGILRLSISWE